LFRLFGVFDGVDNYKQHFDELQEMFVKVITKLRSSILNG